MSSILLKKVNFSYPVLMDSNRSFKKLLLRKNKTTKIHSLKNVTLSADSGERIGLIGNNGAGKTTLLKLLTGIYQPESGISVIKGKVSSLLNINLGVNDELSGIENIKTRGLLMGVSKVELQKKLDEIIDFTELGKFINFPVKTYSAGMKIRIAFSVCTAFKPEILIMDEWLSAGDERFQIKANTRLNNMIQKSNILVIASHNLNFLKKTCNRIIYIKDGSIESDSSVNEGIDNYVKQIGKK